MRKFFFIPLFCSIFFIGASGQTGISKDSIAETPVKSNLSYEALTQFFQSAITTGRNGGFAFKSSLFGIRKLFSKKDLELSDYYLRNKVERNMEFSAGVNKSSDGTLNMLQAGIKYALINNRSKSDINFLTIPDVAERLKHIGNVLFESEKIYQSGIDNERNATTKARKQKQFDDALKKYTKTQSEKDLPAGMQSIIDSIIRSGYAADGSRFFQLAQTAYDSAAMRIDQRGLLTLSFNPGYAWNDHRFDSSALVLQYLKGFGNFKKPWNIDGQLRNYFLHDTTGKTKNLSRSIAVAMIGVNKTLITDTKMNPILEFELAFEDDFVHQGLYAGEEKNRISLNSILRIHISREIAVPLTLQFDLKHPQLFGFLRIDWNLEHERKSS